MQSRDSATACSPSASRSSKPKVSCTRVVYPETPVRIEYHLTEKGQDLSMVVEAISDWSARWACEEPADLRNRPSWLSSLSN